MKIVIFILRVAASLTFLAQAYQSHRFSNYAYSWLYVDLGFSEVFCDALTDLTILILLISSVCIWTNKKVSWFCLIAVILLLLDAIGATFHPPDPTAIFNLPCVALRAMTPITLILLFHGYIKPAQRVLVIATSLTFLGHGLKALFEDPTFLDYILAFFSDIGLPISFNTGILLLHIIGVIDIALAHHISFFRWQRLPWALRYMVLWGLVTALARVTFMGWGSWHEVILRSTHSLAPLALLLLMGSYSRIKSSSPNSNSTAKLS